MPVSEIPAANDLDSITHQSWIAALKVATPNLPAKDQGFAHSLAKQFDQKGSLSEKQWFWVEKLAASVAPNPAVKAPATATAAPAAPVVQNVAPGAFGAFAAAVPAGNKLPKVIIALNDENDAENGRGKFGALRLRRKPGQSYIKLEWRQNPKSGPDWAYVGVLKSDDSIVFYHGMKWTAPGLDKINVIGGLEEFGENVVEVLVQTGKTYGICANCGKVLTHPVSKDMGIGPVCVTLWPDLAQTYSANMALYNAGKY